VPTPSPATTVESLGGLDVAFVAAGAENARRVVFIHGLGQDHRIWELVQSQFPLLTTYAYDIRGHGGSSLGEADGTVAQLGADLIAFLEHFGPATCVGFSLGGVIALWAAAERSDLVEGVIAVATSSVVGKAAASAMQERIELFTGADIERIHELLLADTRSQLGNPAIDPEQIAKSRASAVANPAGYINGARAVCSMRDVSVNDRLGDITAPVLIVSGELDAWCPRRAAEIMMEQLPQATFIELPRVGHLVTDDDPQLLCTVIRDWL